MRAGIRQVRQWNNTMMAELGRERLVFPSAHA